MQHLHGDDTFDRLFRANDWQRAFHLETQDTYTTPEEDEPFRKFLTGEPDDYSWCHSWETLIHEVTSTGKLVQRVRLVSVPHVDYTRFGLAIAALNVAAGEDVRWLPRSLIDPSELTTDDYWLFDDDLVVFTLFTPSGAASGVALTTDPVIAAHCRTVRDRVWSKAIPHEQYLTSEYITAQS